MRISVLLAVAIALLPRSARADDELSPAAKARRDAGAELTSAGKYDEAIREFKAAYDIDPDPVLFYSLAVAERLAGRCAAAVDYYQRFLRSKPNPKRTEAAQAGIAMCERKRAPTATAAPCRAPAPRVAESARPPWYRNPAAGLIAGGVIAAGVGTGFLIAADGTRDRAELARFSDDFEASLERATGQRRTGAVLLVVGAALAGGGVAYELAVRRKPRPTTAFGIGARSIFVARSF
jgi:tetratricopeptide (TPR) repeat protein